MKNDETDYEERIAAVQKADRQVKFCAFYHLTKGLTVPARPMEVMKLFAEMKFRLSKGSWKSIAHLRADILGRYAPSESRRK